MKCINVALIGRPSSGKSTFLNTILGTKLSITASTPQTTKKIIRGIYTEDRGQIVFNDTPGISNFDKSTKKLSKISYRNLNSAEAVLFIVDAWDEEKEEAKELVKIIKENVTAKNIPLLVLINKCDIVSDEKINKRIDFIKKELETAKIYKISALQDEGIDEVLIDIFSLAKENKDYFDPEIFTDENLDDRVGEMIRESAIHLLKEELPHIISVDVEDIEYNEKSNKIWIRAFINVKRQSQKGIVIGKGGKVISLIKKNALSSLKEYIFPDSSFIDLDLSVRVKI